MKFLMTATLAALVSITTHARVTDDAFYDPKFPYSCMGVDSDKNLFNVVKISKV